MDTLKIEFTQDEITLLFEALDEWESVPVRKAFSDMLVTAITSRNEEEAKRTIKEWDQSVKRQELGRKRRSILLKAKLIQAAEQTTTNDLFSAKGD